MNREIVLKILRKYKEEMGVHYGIKALGVFGSVARGQEKEESDVDVVFITDEPNLLRTSIIRQDIEDLLGQPVDIVRLRDSMNPQLKARIAKEAVYV